MACAPGSALADLTHTRASHPFSVLDTQMITLHSQDPRGSESSQSRTVSVRRPRAPQPILPADTRALWTQERHRFSLPVKLQRPPLQVHDMQLFFSKQLFS